MADQATKKPVIRQGWLRVLLFAIVFGVLTLLIAIPAIGVVVAGISLDQLKAETITSLSQTLMTNYFWLIVMVELAVSFISVAIFRLWIDRRSLGSLGWSLDAFPNEAVTGLFMGPALLGIAALLMKASGHLEWTDITWDPSTTFVSLGLMAFIAFSEELVFRGYVLGNLMESFSNKWVALILSALLFAIFHFANPGLHTLAFVNLFLAGTLLGINYIYTKNLWFSFFFHLSWNFFQGPILGFHVSGFQLPSVLVAEPKGDLSITGGDFGLEGSILTTAVSVIALCVLALVFEKKYRQASSSTAPGPT
ncbi:CPBP family intramembrane glutamic endopeptidase [Puia dinghuensis]|nr:CPBP family intramembrane glutamic endopeptidase [Puia dinghuensis]